MTVHNSSECIKSEEYEEKVHQIDLPEAPEGYAPFRRSSFLRRSVSQRGYCALQKKKRSSSYSYYINYIKDPFTTLIDCRWRWMIILYTLSFLVTWFLFGIFWWIIAYAHGDLMDNPYDKPSLEPCVTLMHDFVSSFLFSLETQYTTGYGTRAPTTQCPEAIFLVCVQSIFGVLFQSVMVGIVFAKLARPKTRGESILFSKKAVISMRNGKLCLMFRLGDDRKSHVIGCKLHAWLIQTKTTKEGEVLPNYLTKFNVSVDDGGSSLFLLWPVIVTHCIDSSSPLYGVTAADLENSQMEIVISLVCTAETTGQQTEVRCSYTSRDIVWGHRFLSIVQRVSSDFVVDYSQFNCTESVDTPKFSAKQLEILNESNNEGENGESENTCGKRIKSK